MTSKPAIFFVFALIVFRAGMVIAQAPNISYASPQVYPVNISITALKPVNTGGAVPPNVYGQVSTFVGTGKAGSSDGTGTSASLSGPLGLAIDAAGNIYVSDYNNNTIRKITVGGVVSTIAGIAGAHGAANGANATFSLPEGLAVDKSGNIYIADSFNNLVRKLAANGSVSTYAGTTGISGSQDGTGTTATFSSPYGVAVDKAGNVYVADQNNNTIRKITPVGSPVPVGSVTTLAGTAGKTGAQDGAGTAASFYSPAGIAIDDSGNLYIADAGNNLIRKVTSAGVVSTLAGSGTAGSADGVGAAASFYYPTGIAIDASGILYVADEKNNLIRKIMPDGTVTTLAGNGSGGSADGVAKNATFSYPGPIVADGNGNIYAGDINSYDIRKIGITGYTIDKPLPAGLSFDVKTGIIAGTPTAASPATDYTITAYNALGSSSAVVNITIIDNTALAPNISYKTPLTYAVGKIILPLAPVNTGGAVPATDYGRVTTFAGNGAAGGANGIGSSATFNFPFGITVDTNGNLYVADQQNNSIRKITSGAMVSTFAGTGLQGATNGQGNISSFFFPEGITIDAFGNLYVSDDGNSLIRKITPGGAVSTFAGNGSASSIDGVGTAAGFNDPRSSATDVTGNIYVADIVDNIIRKISPLAVVTTVAGSKAKGAADGVGSSASFNGPAGLTMDVNGNVYIADAGNQKIRKMSADGTVTTVAGNGAKGFTDGQGALAAFKYPMGMATDLIGNLYVCDRDNGAIRMINPMGMVTTVAGNGDLGFQDGIGHAASFNDPQAIVITNGVAFVADAGNNSIRKLILTGYTIDKPLPPGLNFNGETGIITGTPTAASPATDYTIIAYNAWGSSSAVVNIAVTARALPVLAPNISYQTPQVYTINTGISPLAPNNTGGAVPAAIYGQVSTFAGSGSVGVANGQATSATFHTPMAATTDAAGNIYIADNVNALIRKIAPDGSVTTVAGSGTKGNVDGNGTAASFDAIFGVTIDAAGNLFVTDEGNNLIRKITPAGDVSTFAGSGTVGAANGTGTQATFNHPFGITADDAGNIYVAEGANNLIRKITPAGVVTTLAGSGNNGAADGNGTAASFEDPTGITTDAAGNLYVSDSRNELIRKITPNGTVSTIAGTGAIGSANGPVAAASFYYPFGLTVDGAGNIYICDVLNNLVRKISPQGQVSTLAGSGAAGFADGTGTAAIFNNPSGMGMDIAGNLVVVDSYNERVRKIAISGYTIDKTLPAGLTFDPKTGIISGTPTAVSPATDYTITAFNAGGSSSTVANITVQLNSANAASPPKISYQTPQTYLINKTIVPLSPVNTGGAVPANIYSEVTTVAGTRTAGSANGAASSATFNGPAGLVFDNAGNLFITENINNDIREITPAGIVSTFAGDGSEGNKNGPGNGASFNLPHGITADVTGNLYVADEGNQVIRKITPAGLVSTFAGDGTTGTTNGPVTSADFVNPIGLVFDPASDLWITDRGNSVIRKIDISGQVSAFATLEPNNGAADNTGTFLGYLAADNLGNLYVPDNNQVKKISPTGAVTILAGTTTPGNTNATGTAASFSKLYGIAIDAPGNVYVGDSGNNLIRKITPAGVVTTLAGSGGRGGTDGLGPSASFYAPYGVTVDNTGNFLYVTDTGEQLIRKIGITGYAIDKSLPTGMSFDAATGTISGTPAVSSPATDYIITAYNTAGSSSTVVNLEVINPQTVAFGPIAEKTVCDADFDPGATGNGPITYSSSDTGIAEIVSGRVHITGAGTAQITADDGISQIKQAIKVIAAVAPSVTITPETTDDCEGVDVTYTATPANGGSNPAFQWQVNGKNMGVNNRQFTINNLKNNDKITCILTSNAACVTGTMATSNTASFTLDAPVTTSVTISSSATGPICGGSPVTFTATATTPDGNPGYQWLVNNFDAGSNSNTFTTSSLADGDVVTVILRSTGKCLVNPDAPSNSIKINVNPVSLCTISIPNAFTPNGDGINDLWNITALVSYPGCTVNIFNRYGSLVYSSIGYPKPWDGTNNGQPLPIGTYYYIIDPKNGAKKLSGFVTVLR